MQHSMKHDMQHGMKQGEVKQTKVMEIVKWFHFLTAIPVI